MATDKNYDAYVEYVYQIVRGETIDLDTVYESYIIALVGKFGLQALKECKLIETCGVMYGRQLYVLCCEKES